MKKLFLLLLLATSCGSTGGALVTLPMRAGGRASGPLTFTNPKGWTVTLQTAKVALGPFYFNAFPPSTESFRNGTFIIEATAQTIVNALDATMHDVPGGADGETGRAVAVEIDLFPPDATQPPSASSELGGKVGLVAGTATKGATTISFRGPITIDTNLVTPQTPLLDLERVKGAVVDVTFTAAPQAIELRVDPQPWFDQTDFAELLQSTPTGGVYTWDVHSTFLKTLVQGVKSETRVYLFQLVPQ
jgi:hypothetical protein